MSDQLLTLARAVQHMRELQREYFKTRDRATLVASKQAEREVDQLVAAALSPTAQKPAEARERGAGPNVAGAS